LGQNCVDEVFALDHVASPAFFHLLVQFDRVGSGEFLAAVGTVLS
jgi:hypothetical protein